MPHHLLEREADHHQDLEIGKKTGRHREFLRPARLQAHNRRPEFPPGPAAGQGGQLGPHTLLRERQPATHNPKP